MEFWVEKTDPSAPGHPLACSLEERKDCRVRLVDGTPYVKLGPLCGLRRVFRELLPAALDGDFWLDVAVESACRGEHRAQLDSVEFIVIAAVAAGRGHFVSYESIAAAVWGESCPETAGALVRSKLRSIREKLRNSGIGQDALVAVEGLGVRLNSPANGL